MFDQLSKIVMLLQKMLGYLAMWRLELFRCKEITVHVLVKKKDVVKVVFYNSREGHPTP